MFDIRTVTPPGIAFVLAFALVYSGLSMNNPGMVVAGWVFLGVGVFLQVAYLLLRNWRPRLPAERRPGRVRRTLFRLLVADPSDLPGDPLDDATLEERESIP